VPVRVPFVIFWLVSRQCLGNTESVSHDDSMTMRLSNSVNEVSVFIRESSQDDDDMNDVSIVITQDDNSMMRRAHTMMIS
jgi:hypothetical protein